MRGLYDQLLAAGRLAECRRVIEGLLPGATDDQRGTLHADLAQCHLQDGNPAGALAAAELGIYWARRTEGWDALGVSLFRAAAALGMLRQHEAALERLAEWERHECQYANPARFRPLVLFNRGVALRALGRLEEAAGTFRDALEWHERRGEDGPANRARRNLTWVLLKLDRLEEVPDLLTATERYLREHPEDPESTAHFLVDTAIWHLAWGRIEDARKAARKAVAAADNIDNAGLAVEALLVLSAADDRIGFKSSARGLALEALRRSRSLGPGAPDELQDEATVVLLRSCDGPPGRFLAVMPFAPGHD